MADSERDRDFNLLERYQGVSAEFVRIALLGIGAVGLLYTLEPGKQPAGLAALGPRICFGVAVFVLGVAAACGIFHRYFSTDAMAYQIKIDREESKPTPDRAIIEKEKKGRDWAFDWSGRSILGSAIALAVGSLALGCGFVCMLFRP
jgi:hypothetical protein